MVTVDPISRVTEISISLGWTADEAAPVVAAMMAWSGLAPRTDRPEGQAGYTPGFFDDHNELTARAWSTVLSHLRRQRSTEGDAWAFDGIEGTTTNVEPGKLKSLRQVIRDFLSSRTAKEIDLDKMRQGAQLLLTNVTDEDPSLTTLLIKALRAEQKSSVYCGFDLAAPIALELAKEHSVFLQLPSVSLARVAALLAIAGKYSLKVSCSNPMDLASTPKYSSQQISSPRDYSVVLPPFGRRYLHEPAAGGSHWRSLATEESSYYIHLALNRSYKRRLVLLPDGFLFRTTKNEQKHKRSLVVNDGLSSVISLPRGIIGGDRGVLSSLLVFDSSATGAVEGIKFVDCRSKWSNKPKFESADGTQTRLRSWLSRINSSSDDRYLTTVKLDELDANDFNLLVDRYVIDPKVRQQRQLLARQETIPLDDIAELYRPQVIKSSPESRWPTIDQIITIREVATGDIHDGIVGKPDKEIDLWAGDINQIERAILRPGDILISIKGKVGVAGVVPAEAPSGVFGAWLPGQPFVIARLRRSAAIANPVVLARYLTSPNGQAQLWALAGGTTVSFIQMADLLTTCNPAPYSGNAAKNYQGNGEDRLAASDHSRR